MYQERYYVVLTFESVDEMLKCYHSNESYWAVLSLGAVYYAVRSGSNFWICGWNPKVWPSNESYSTVVLFIMLYKVVLTFVCGWNPKYGLLWCCSFFHILRNKIWAVKEMIKLLRVPSHALILFVRDVDVKQFVSTSNELLSLSTADSFSGRLSINVCV